MPPESMGDSVVTDCGQQSPDNTASDKQDVPVTGKSRSKIRVCQAARYPRARSMYEGYNGELEIEYEIMAGGAAGKMIAADTVLSQHSGCRALCSSR